MSIQITYKPLCYINLYHNYFLNDGLTPFDDSPTLKEEQLGKYTFSDFARIVPSKKTEQFLKNQKILFKTSTTGFTLLVQAVEAAGNNKYNPFIEISENENLQFLIYITDTIFENYSTVNPIPEIPYYFSNQKPNTETSGWNFMMTENQTPKDIESYTINENTYQALFDNITNEERKKLFGIISLNTNSNNGSKNLLDSRRRLKNTNINRFKIQLANRKTFWQYLDAKDGNFIHKSPTQLPLVKNGIINYTFDTTARRPAAQPNRLVYVKNSSGTIIETISEIFI